MRDPLGPDSELVISRYSDARTGPRPRSRPTIWTARLRHESSLNVYGQTKDVPPDCTPRRGNPAHFVFVGGFGLFSMYFTYLTQSDKSRSQ